MVPQRDMDKHIANEVKMQKFRWLTPAGLVFLSCIVTAGFGFIGWCGDTAVKSLTSHFDAIEQKQDVMFKALSSIRDREATDIKCLDNDFAKCSSCRNYEVC